MSDEVLEKLWNIRREYDQEVGGTLEGLFTDLARRERTKPVRLIDRSKLRRATAAAKQAGKVAEKPADYETGKKRTSNANV